MLLLQSVQIFVKVLTRQWSNQADSRIPFSESADSPVNINRCWFLNNFALLEEHWRRSTNSSRSSLTEGNYPLNTERVQGLRRRSKTEHPETCGPVDTTVHTRSGGLTVQLCGDSNVACKWINGEFSLRPKYRGEIGLVQRTVHKAVEAEIAGVCVLTGIIDVIFI